MPTSHISSRSAVIIGGGPAGLMAAERLATAGWTVAVHDRMPTLARKFLMAGRGGLNLTHSEPLDRFLTRYRDPSGAIAAAITAFPPDTLRTWAESLGEATYVGSSGRVFPKTMKASPLLRAWIRRLEGLGVTFHLRSRWIGWDAAGQARCIDATGAETKVSADATILALGGASWPRLGSDGAWVPVLTSAGIPVIPFDASNCGVHIDWSEPFRTRFAGSPLKRIVVSIGDFRAEGEVMITASGLEGGAIYAVGRAIRSALRQQDGPVRISLDLRPALDETALGASLSLRRKGDSLANILRKSGLSPAAIGLLRETLGKSLDPDPMRLAQAIKATPLAIHATAPIDRAISSDGGVSFGAVNSHLMLQARPGVFLAGEMLDWDAPTGGYLLQATFATAIRAAEGAIDWYGRTGKGR